ncbi:type I restriction enzyme R subunit [Nocardia kruczakiae]|uniref:Type I restriction enzyme endonuclease subunit n=1 Tax=Nocardia kruczakiae TaxID=261477 RepID=A0ABU1XPF9_9NOCA|nr:type I restriction endonuclease subunit R [Nocardia kruczakiae]MDR7171782.1 type I restriction enzyme R subunit [Nocardia kruczakiae]
MTGSISFDDDKISENQWESDALELLGGLGWEPGLGKDQAPGSGYRRDWDELVLHNVLREAVERLNPDLPPSAVRDAVQLATDPSSRDVYAENKQAHSYLTAGVRLTYTDGFGAEHTPTVRLVDFGDQNRNVYHAVRQVRVLDRDFNRRFDIVLYVNGLPLAVVELKSAADEHATLRDAHAQLQTYRDEFPIAFRYNVLCLISDGITAKFGTAFTPYEHFAPWNVDGFGKRVDTTSADYDGVEAVDLALSGLFQPDRFLSLVSNFVNFTPQGKRIAKPHQYFAVTKAVDSIVEASRSDGKAGVVWHTQGAGKSEEMVETAALVSRHPELNNPTIVVVTDRNDLDDQLYETFQDSKILLGQEPKQVTSREELRTALSNNRVGGIYFTTLQKFGRTKAEKDSGWRHPLLSDRRNLIVIVDEAHRSHYETVNGYAKHIRDALPFATFIAFTGTPVSGEADTQETFGNYIDVYDLKRAVDDEATVRVYHEPRVIGVSLPPDIDPDALDQKADSLTADLDDAERREAIRYAAAMNTIYGAPGRIATLADDLIAHWERRRELMKPQIGGPGKAMVVCGTREICVRLFDALAQRRPWASDEVDKGVMKIVFHSDPSDPTHLRAHGLRTSQQKVIRNRIKDVDDELELLIVHSMLLTGFDSPPIHTMYMDRPMQGANLMQAVARVNRRFRGKQDGLLVGYAPLTDNLTAALKVYSPDDQRDRTLGANTDRAITEVKNELATIRELLRPTRWEQLLADTSRAAPRKRALRLVSNYLRAPSTSGNVVEPGEKKLSSRFKECVSRLERFYRICSTARDLDERCADLGDWQRDITFFSEVRAWMVKLDAADREANGQPVTAEVRIYLQQLAASVVDASDITDLYEEAGIGHVDITNINQEQLHRLSDSETPDLVAEALQRLVKQKMREVTRHNIVSHEQFSKKLDDLMKRYMSQQYSSAVMIAKLAELMKEISEEALRGERFDPPLNPAELAFYDAVAKDGMAKLIEGGDATLAEIARALVLDLQSNLPQDWLTREPVRAKLRTRIRRLLAKYDYPPEGEDKALDVVLKQMETFAADWSPKVR